MLDQHEAHDDRNNIGHDMPHRDAAGDRPIADRPVADREVPLPGMAAADDPTMVAIHQWLDGELPEAEARRMDTKQVDMWNRIAGETEQRRRMVTPAYVAANIMNALPEKQVATQAAKQTATAITPTSTGLSIGMVAAIGATMLALGIIIGKMIA
jgi:hypothetical protein